MRRLNGLYKTVRLQAWRKFEEQCGADKAFDMLGGRLECEDTGRPGQNLTEIELGDDVAASRLFVGWYGRNGRSGNHAALAIKMRLKVAEKIGLEFKNESMDLDA